MSRFDQALIVAVGDRRGVAAADRLCQACVEVLAVDGAALSLVLDESSVGTVGVSDHRARIWDEVQFTLGEGPGLRSVRSRKPVLVPDLRDGGGPDGLDWAAYDSVMLSHGIHAVFAAPVLVAGECVGALDLFRCDPGPLAPEAEAGVLVAAQVAGRPLRDLLGDELLSAPDDLADTTRADLHAITRTEVSQATGMLMAQLEIDPDDALARLRAHAFATDRSVMDVARDILARRLRLSAD